MASTDSMSSASNASGYPNSSADTTISVSDIFAFVNHFGKKRALSFYPVRKGSNSLTAIGKQELTNNISNFRANVNPKKPPKRAILLLQTK